MSLKDFDFEPEYSVSDLVGGVVILRELADSKVWKKKPFDPAHALVDLHLLANNADGEFKLDGGGTVQFRAGWCLWSNRGLAERWGWRQESVETFLKQLETLDVIRRHVIPVKWKAIELVHWRSIAGASPEHGCSIAGGKVGDGGELGDKSKELGEGVPPRMVTLEMALKYFTEVEAGYSPEQIRDQWRYYDAMRDTRTGDWQKPRGGSTAMTRISDWRTELARALDRSTEKNAAAAPQKNAAADFALADLRNEVA